MNARRPMGRVLAIGAVLIAATSCSIRIDSVPRDISNDERPTTPAVASSIAIQPGAQSTIYLLTMPRAGGPSQLKAVGRAESPTAQNVLTTLFAGANSADQTKRLHSAIAPGTVLRRAVSLGNNVLLVDVSSRFLQTNGEQLVDAVAQVVFTACNLPGIDAVQLEVEGAVHEWPRGNGTSSAAPLTPFDFPERDPSTQPDYPAVPSQTPGTS
jgi:spore germination protein GerM